MLRRHASPPDLPTQLDDLLAFVWRCEDIERRSDRLNAAIDHDEHIKRMKESRGSTNRRPPDDRL